MRKSKRITMAFETWEKLEAYRVKYNFRTYWDFINVAVHLFCNYLDNKREEGKDTSGLTMEEKVKQAVEMSYKKHGTEN